jgi:hypothetical protein
MMRRAGFPTKELVTGVSIAMAESSLHVDADNGSHVGLFQIADDKGYDRGKLKSDPQYNVNAAYQVWKSQGWARGWLNYEHGASYKNTATAAAAVAQSRKAVPDSKLKGWTVHSDDTSAAHGVADAVGAGGVYQGVQDVAGGVTDTVGGALSILTNLDTWVRVGEVVGGSVMFIAGMVLLARINT